MKPGIADLGKWTEKTVGAVRHICHKKTGPCVGFALLFIDPLAVDEKQWNYVIELAYDPANPPSEEEQKDCQKAFEYIMEDTRSLFNRGLALLKDQGKPLLLQKTLTMMTLFNSTAPDEDGNHSNFMWRIGDDGEVEKTRVRITKAEESETITSVTIDGREYVFEYDEEGTHYFVDSGSVAQADGFDFISSAYVFEDEVEDHPIARFDYLK